MSYVTFIIPTLGRPSIAKTLESLYNQTDQDWKAIVVHDGGATEITGELTSASVDGKVFYINSPKMSGGAGVVRNRAFPLVFSKWVAFVDDDDFLHPEYISRLKYWDDHGFDLVQFTYRDVENGNTQPPPGLDYLVACNFGISFAVKNSFIKEKGIKFTPGGIEDYRFLQECLDNGAKYAITHEIMYFVGHRSAWN